MSYLSRSLERMAQPPADPVDAGSRATVGHAASTTGPADPPAVTSDPWAAYAALPEWEKRQLAGDR